MIVDRAHFPHYLNEVGLTGVGVEVGVDLGIYANHLLTHWKGKKLVGVDPWSYMPDRLTQCVERNQNFISEGRYQLIREKSVNGALQVPDKSCDFIYIDAVHYESHVKADIKAWVGKVVPGGYLCGHDFCLSGECTVPPAVLRFAYDAKLPIWITPCTSWWIRLP